MFKLLSVAVAAVVMSGVGTANAATTGFTAQTEKAGLSVSQARELQGEVDGYVSRTGGRQVSANKVVFDGGTVVVAAPGQRYARDLGDAAAPRAVSCPSGLFCMFSGTYETGTQVNWYELGDTYDVTWDTTGSWINHAPTDDPYGFGGDVDLLGPGFGRVDAALANETRNAYDWSTTYWVYGGIFIA